MTRLFAAAVLAALLSPGSPASAQAPAPPATCTFHGHISDSLGAAIFRGFFLVHSYRWADSEQHLKLNDSGEFEVQLKPGLYDFFVSSPGFIPFTKEIDLRTCKPVDLKVKLKVDLEHLED